MSHELYSKSILNKTRNDSNCVSCHFLYHKGYQRH